MKSERLALVVIGALVFITLGAGACAYVTRDEVREAPKKAAAEQRKSGDDITWNQPRQQPQQQAQAVPSCDDANVVGAAIGAVAGGFAGNQVGKGRGQDLATVGGAIGGGYLGQQYIPTRNVLCR